MNLEKRRRRDKNSKLSPSLSKRIETFLRPLFIPLSPRQPIALAAASFMNSLIAAARAALSRSAACRSGRAAAERSIAQRSSSSFFSTSTSSTSSASASDAAPPQEQPSEAELEAMIRKALPGSKEVSVKDTSVRVFGLSGCSFRRGGSEVATTATTETLSFFQN